MPAEERLTREHRSKRPTAEDMHVQMRDLLVRVGTGVREQPVSASNQPRIARDVADGTDEAGDFRV
jgi:hypothetical protein